MSRILVIDDEAVVRSLLRRLLSRRGHEVEVVDSVAAAIEGFDVDDFDLVVSDLNMPGAPGTDIIARCRRTPVLVMASYANVKSAVEAMRLGATDFVAKPFDHDELMAAVQQALAAPANTAAADAEPDTPAAVPELVGNCPAMRLVRQRVALAGPSMASVLITGEAGTGKAQAAKSIHAASTRAHTGLTRVHCAAIAEDPLAAELFGYEPGAFEGAVRGREGLIEGAEGGTLFFDEVAVLPMSVQAGLAQVIETAEVRRLGGASGRRVDVRVIAATGEDLAARVAVGRFHEALFDCLRVVEICLPPLRERGADIDLLARHFLARIAAESGRPSLTLGDNAVAAIHAHSWPGNVGELAQVITQAAATVDSTVIDAVVIDAMVADAPAPATSGSLDDYFRRFVREHEGQMTETALARRLGISRKTLWERRQRLGIPRRAGRGGRARRD